MVTLLVTTALLAVAVNLATVVQLGLQRASLGVTTLPLFTQAESGAERALFRLRQLKLLPGELGLATNCDCGGLCPAITGCSVKATFPTTADLAILPLKKDQSFQLDLVDVTPDVRECSSDAGGGLSPAACITRVTISCTDADGASPLGTLAITSTRVADVTSGWGGSVAGSTRQAVVYFGSPQSYYCTGGAFDFTGDPPGSLVASASYTIKIRAIISDVNINWVKAYNGTQQRGLPSRVRITSTVSAPLQQQQVQLDTASRAPISGLLDYVLYSECGIDKTLPTPSPSCP